MGLFHRKEAQVHVDPALIDALKKYVEQHRATNAKTEEKKPDRSGIRYSLAEPSYFGDTILDMKRFMSDARQDTAMFDSPALQKSYHEWERKASTKKTFSSEVLKKLNELHMKPAEFYKAVGLDKRVFHALKSDYLYTPSKATAIRCCLGLRLKYEEAIELLKLAGYSFSPSNSRELVIRFCMENEVYDLPSINYMLLAMGEEPLA